MSKIKPRTIDERMDSAAESAFISEGGGSIPKAPSQRERDIKEFSIRRDGLGYEYGGYHYDLLSDAIGYARLVRARSQLRQGGPLTQTAGPAEQAADDAARADPAFPLSQSKP